MRAFLRWPRMDRSGPWLPVGSRSWLALETEWRNHVTRGPACIAADAMGNVCIADSGNHASRRLDPDGTAGALAVEAGSGGSADGADPDARFNGPRALEPDGAGNADAADPPMAEDGGLAHNEGLRTALHAPCSAPS